MYSSEGSSIKFPWRNIGGNIGDSFFSDLSILFKVEKYAKVEKSIKSDDSQPTVWPAHVSYLDLWPNFIVSS